MSWGRQSTRKRPSKLNSHVITNIVLKKTFYSCNNKHCLEDDILLTCNNRHCLEEDILHLYMKKTFYIEQYTCGPLPNSCTCLLACVSSIRPRDFMSTAPFVTTSNLLMTTRVWVACTIYSHKKLDLKWQWQYNYCICKSS